MKTTRQKDKKHHAHLLAALAIVPALALAPGEGWGQTAAKPAAKKRAAKAAKPRAAPAAANPGFEAADAAYREYEKRDYAAAVRHAEEAVRLAPQRRDYWVLLVNSLLAARRVTDAEQALQRGVQAAGDDAAFNQARDTLKRAQAQAAGAEMYRALQANDVPRAIAQARAAVEYAPEHPAYRLALVHALLRGNQFADAERVAGETVALLPDSAAPLTLRAYARQQQGRWADAKADYDRALAQRGLSAAAQRELRLVAADAAMAAGEPQRAVTLLGSLPANDAAAQQRLALARQMVPAPALSKAVAFPPPAIDCSNVEQAQTCTVVAAAPPANPGYQAATLAYRAMEAKDYAVALDQARAATAAAPGNVDYHLLHMQAALANNRNDEAQAAGNAALALSPNDGRVQLELAYAANRMGDARRASEAFAQADAAKQLPATALQDAGYAAMHARRDAAAVEYFKRSVDAAEALQLKMEPQMLYATRRTISELERKWGVLASLTYGRSGIAAPGFGVSGGSGSIRTLQAGAEAYWRPWGFMNGRFVELFVRGFETLSSEGNGATGGDTFQGAVGIRWKPLTTQNVVLSFSRLFGNTTSDWLAQAGYSMDIGTDLRVDVPSWWTTRIAAEVGRYFSPSHTYGLASAMVGRSYRLGDGRWVALPHVVLAGEYDSTLNDKTAFGAGAGVSVRRWFREDRYHAPQSYVDVTLQYRVPIGGDDRLKGPYINTLLSY